MRVMAIPVLKDNFSYLLIQDGFCVVIDPGDSSPVAAALAREGIELSAIWLTHHHWDHIGGVAGLAKPEMPVVAHSSDRARLPMANHFVDDGDTVAVGPLTATILHNPGHTLGAITYVVDGAAFTGDTLFGAGCGRVFEGSMEMMHASLQKLAALPPQTRVYFGHEYTAANLAFAAHVEPDNVDVNARANAVPTPSTPSTIALELATNPFLRAKSADEFAGRRKAKDTF